MSDIDRDSKLEDGGDNMPLVALHLPYEDVFQPRPDPLHHSFDVNEGEGDDDHDDDDDEDNNDGDEDDLLGYPPMTTTTTTNTKIAAPAVSNVALNSNLIVVEAHDGNQSNVSLSDAVDYSRRVT